MLPAFLLGLAGSFTHCVGMCTGVMLLLGRGRRATGWRLLLLHAGRLTTYAALGALAATLGQALNLAASALGHHHAATSPEQAALLPGLTMWQGALSLLAAAAAIYMALAVLGRVPSPELLLARVTRWWGRMARKIMGLARSETGQSGRSLRGASFAPKQSTPSGEIASAQTTGLAMTYLSGVFWGLLPCGLVLTGLLLAAASDSALAGVSTLLAFGAGTLPFGLAAGWLGRQIRPSLRWAAWLRPAAALVVLLFGVQMALRGLAAWGWVAHSSIGALPLW
jgi:hypothetical protein